MDGPWSAAANRTAQRLPARPPRLTPLSLLDILAGLAGSGVVKGREIRFSEDLVAKADLSAAESAGAMADYIEPPRRPGVTWESI